MQEMHPEADEVIYIVSGSIDLIIDEPAGERLVPIQAGEAAIVPRGMWHRLVMRKPGKLLFINSRTGMQGRRATSNKPSQPISGTTRSG
jgi:mannose-6-phosphate isomerase-like protein (cupin superfamily)